MVFQRFRQPVVLGYIIAGLIVGPHVPVPLIADKAIVQTLSELGRHPPDVLSRPRVQSAPPDQGGADGRGHRHHPVRHHGLAGVPGGPAVRLDGHRERVSRRRSIAISSTTIIAKVFDEQKIGGRLRELVVGILLMEDLIAIVFMAALTAVATGAGLSAATLLPTVGKLATLPGGAAGRRDCSSFRASCASCARLDRAETTLVASIGICFTIAFAAQRRSATRWRSGAFLAGSLVAESGARRSDRAPDHADPRHVPRDLLRLGRLADRSGPRGSSTGSRSWC